ncbi:translocon-associated protein subunit alpha, partial [Tremellales sp. Uapishka_1]
MPVVVNGEQNGLNIHLNNVGSKNYTLVSAAASYHDPANYWSTIKNTTTLKYNVPLISGANFSAPFSMYSEFKPQELGLTVWVNLAETGTSDLHRITALNQTVAITEPPTGWFDLPLLFLYLLIGTALTGAAYAAYNTFVVKSSKKGKRNVVKKKVVVPADSGKVYPDVKPYEEEWIPEQHLRSRQPKPKKKGGASSAGEEITSGGDTSGGEKKRKSKGKK